MNKVAIVTDTTACIPQEQVTEHDIELVPVQLIFGDKAYRDGIDITPTEFYALLKQTEKLPSTSASSPAPYLEAYRRSSERTDSILCLTEPTKFSAMYDSAQIAARMAKTMLRNVAIEVLAVTTAAAGQGLVALAAARAAESGKTLAEVTETARSVTARVELFAMLDTLHYLVKGGRVPQAAGLVNSLLKFKPIFTLQQADAHTVALPRSAEDAIKYMLKAMKQKVVKGQPLHVAVMHAAAPEQAKLLRNKIASLFDCSELFITEFTPVMGVHTGPGLFGVAFHSGE